ncbi:hypothetical protein VPG91_11370 [Nitrospirillum amazonense]|uniref:hypothetical protein n=1 Tax=Nitrospirillum amazonense TaxID=28077 RepID=UPI002DD42861|nr:hypothetical protein [Nitrospirillum amazonense]MEC4591588.1 hypothetical protein [Nitrospirillum amazonense]
MHIRPLGRVLAVLARAPAALAIATLALIGAPALARAADIDPALVDGAINAIGTFVPAAIPILKDVALASVVIGAVLTKVPPPAPTSRWFVPYHIASWLAINFGHAANKGATPLLAGLAQAYLARNGLATTPITPAPTADSPAISPAQ